MKDYRLNDPPDPNLRGHDNAPSFARRAMTWAKASNEITGLIRGILADGEVVEKEAAYLREWIVKHPDLYDDQIVRVLIDRLERIYADGRVAPEELDELKSVLRGFDTDDGRPATLPLDDPPPQIVFPGQRFCFTGKFVYGTRSACENRIILHGALPTETVRRDTSYLVIGTFVSEGWANQSYGRKIEAAVQTKKKGYPIGIVSEELWLTSMDARLRSKQASG